ncbi:MAG: DNA primase regulatory subunit PriL [Thermoplasmataceae archaeon]
MERLRLSAKDIVLDSMKNTTFRKIARISDLDDFRLVLWILKAIDSLPLTLRVVNRMRDAVERYLNSEDNDSEDAQDNLIRLGIEATYDAEVKLFSVPVSTFITFSSRLSGPKYRLIYQSISGGKVLCGREMASKLAREAFVRNAMSVYSRINRAEAQEVLSGMANYLDEIRLALEKSGISQTVELGDVDYNLFPPCVKTYLTQMHDGVNLPHLARFTLVSFLHKAGMSSEKIIELFRTAPDFNEKFTTYQVNHITGTISTTEYSPPKCSVLASNHLCYKGDDTLCNQPWLKHPLQYYSVKKGRSKASSQ